MLWTWTETSSLHQTDLEFCTTSWLVGTWAVHTLLTICPLMTGISFKRCCFPPGFYVVSGHPATYAEYFSLNKTTAELRVLQPINRDLYQRFTLIIKVIKNKIIFGYPYLWVYCCIIQRQPFLFDSKIYEKWGNHVQNESIVFHPDELWNFNRYWHIFYTQIIVGIVPLMIVLLCLHTR